MESLFALRKEAFPADAGYRFQRFVRLSCEAADEPTGIAPWRTLLWFREVCSSSLLASDVLVMPYSSGVTIRDEGRGVYLSA